MLSMKYILLIYGVLTVSLSDVEALQLVECIEGLRAKRRA